MGRAKSRKVPPGDWSDYERIMQAKAARKQRIEQELGWTADKSRAIPHPKNGNRS